MTDTPEPSREIATVEPQGTSLMGFVAQAVRDPNIDVAKLKALLDIQRELIADDAKAQFNQAFIRLQKRLPRIKKHGVLEYPADKNKPDGPKRKIANFAKWEDIDTAIRGLLDEAGFALSFTTAPRTGDGGGLIVTAILRHAAGHSTETPIPIPLDTSGGKNNIQGYGSALSYGKRYAATAALNIIAEGEDDDARLAGMEFIAAAEVEELQRLIADTKSDEAKLCQHYGVAHLANIQVSQFPAVKNALLQKKKRSEG